MFSQHWSCCRSTLKRHYAKVAQKSGASVERFLKHCSFIILGSSSRKLAEIPPTQPPKPRQQSFTREAAPHTTRVPVPIRNRPVKRPARWSSGSRGRFENRLRGPGREGDRMTERYGQSQKFVGGREARDQVSQNNVRATESYRHYLERRDSRESGKCFHSSIHN